MFSKFEQNKSQIDKHFLKSLINDYIDGLVLNHIAGMMIPSSILPKAMKADLSTALTLLEEAVVEKKCALALFTLINIHDDELSAEDLQRKERCKLESESSEWLLSCLDQALLKIETTTRTINRLEQYYAESPEKFNDVRIISKLKNTIESSENDLCRDMVDELLRSRACPTVKILLEQSKHVARSSTPLLEKRIETMDSYIPEPLRNRDGTPIYPSIRNEQHTAPSSEPHIVSTSYKEVLKQTDQYISMLQKRNDLETLMDDESKDIKERALAAQTLCHSFFSFKKQEKQLHSNAQQLLSRLVSEMEIPKNANATVDSELFGPSETLPSSTRPGNV